MFWTDYLTLFDARFAGAMAAAGLAGFVRGYSGFGAALMFIPLAGILYDPKAAIVILWIIDGIGTVPCLAPHLRRARWSEVIPLLIGSTIAMPVGVWILSHGDPTVLRWAICGTVLLSTAALASGWRYRG